MKKALLEAKHLKKQEMSVCIGRGGGSSVMTLRENKGVTEQDRQVDRKADQSLAYMIPLQDQSHPPPTTDK